jgi:catechol 2,3-dioxygenase-like lactoylglutathione lyase family enzyme
MTIVLNHTIVPTRDKQAAARLFAQLFGLACEAGGHFAKVRVNDGLTLLFDDRTSFDRHHYAFHVSDAEFDAILGRVKGAGIAYGSDPWAPDNGKLNDWGNGRGVYFTDPDGHLFELMTIPQ